MNVNTTQKTTVVTVLLESAAIVNIKKIEMVTTLSGSHHLKIMGTI